VWLDWLVFDDPRSLRSGPQSKRTGRRSHRCGLRGGARAALAYDFGRKRTLDAAGRDACLALCRRVAQRIASPVPEAERALLPACRDPDDQKFLEAALSSRAEFLVTKDRALLDLARRALPFRILTPADFAGAG